MAATVLGRVKSGKGSSYEVKWDPSTGDVYVAWGGWTQSLSKNCSGSEFSCSWGRKTSPTPAATRGLPLLGA